MSGSYYNEHDREKAAWLRELIKAGVIAPGEVDERSIEDVRPSDLDGVQMSPWQRRLFSRYERLAAPSSDVPLPLSVEMWAQERLDTALHMVEQKTGDDRAGWIEDARYWRLIVERLGLGENDG